MKMVVVTTVEEYSDAIRKVFAKNKVQFYSESEMKNFRLVENDESDNWFGSAKHLIAGHILFTFADEETADRLIENIKKLSADNNFESPVRVFQLNVEKFFMNMN
ncbi:MAG: hypothetical protein AB7W47_10505 [Calditrichaceae bacterium]